MSFSLDHIGIAVKSIQESLAFYVIALGLKVSKVETVTDQQVNVAFLDTGSCHIELLEPTSEDSPIAKFISKRGPGIHHVCLQVNELAKLLPQLESLGFILIDKEPRQGAENKMIAFVHPKSTGGVLLELSEPMA